MKECFNIRKSVHDLLKFTYRETISRIQIWYSLTQLLLLLFYKGQRFTESRILDIKSYPISTMVLLVYFLVEQCENFRANPR